MAPSEPFGAPLFGLIPGFRELVLIGLVVLVFFGRSRALRDPRLRALLRPWPATSSTRPGPRRDAPPDSHRAPSTHLTRLADRWYLVLAVTAATAVATWIVARMTMIEAAGSGPAP